MAEGPRPNLARFSLCTSVSAMVKTFSYHREHRGSQGKTSTGANKRAARSALAGDGAKLYNNKNPCLRIQTT